MGLKLPHDWFSDPLPDNVRLADTCWLYSSFAFRHYQSRRPVGVRIGQHTGVYIGTYFELGPQGEVDIGDYCTIVGAIVRTNARVEIADHCYVAHEVVLADDPCPVPPIAPSHAPDITADPRPASISIGRNSWIAARAILLGGTQVGEGAIVGAGAVVRGTVPPYSIVAGNPARVVAHTRAT